MSILGVILRSRPADLPALAQQLALRPGVDLAGNPGDGRLLLVLEDTPEASAAATLGELATWPAVLNTSLVYEYSGPDAPAPGDAPLGFADWRQGLAPPRA